MQDGDRAKGCLSSSRLVAVAPFMGLAKECELSLSRSNCSAIVLRRAFWLSRPVLQDQDGKFPKLSQAKPWLRFSNSVHDSWPYRWPLASWSPCPIIEPFSPGIGGPSDTLLWIADVCSKDTWSKTPGEGGFGYAESFASSSGVSTCIAPVCTYALHGSRACTASPWHLFDAHLEGKSARNSVSGRSSVVGVLRRSARALKKDHGDDPRQLPQQRTALCAACNQPGRNSAGSYAQQLLATFLQNQSGKTSFPMQWAPEAWHALGTACCHFVFVGSW